MKRTAVYIATTEGPSEIQRITPEDPDVRSVICHDGKALALPISPDYDAFVRRPTGVIEACFGHGAYRVDVTDPIASGLSWQLALFIAHALFDEGRLVRSDDKIPQIIWATGEVTRDLAVDEVAEIDCKIRQSERHIRAHLDQGARIVLAVPVGNLIEATRALEDIFGADRDRLQIVPAQTVCDVLVALGLKRRRRTRKWLARTPASVGGRGKMMRRLAYAVSFALLAFTGVTGWQKLAPSVDTGIARAHMARVLPASLRSDPVSKLAAVSVAVRPPAGKPCAAVHLDRVAPVMTRRVMVDGAPVAGLRAAGLCDFRYRLTNKSRQAAILWVMAQRATIGGGGLRFRPIHAEQPLNAGEGVDLDARPPRSLSAPLRQSITVLSAPAGAGADLAGIRAVWRQALQATTSRDANRTLDRARAHGAVIQRLTNDFRP